MQMHRKVNLYFDNKPSIHHIFNFNFSKPYIRNKKVLDVGCWTRQFESLVTSYLKEIAGIDSSNEAINFAPKNYKRPLSKWISVKAGI